MTKEAESPYVFRPYKEEDLNFILNSWGSSYYQNSIYRRSLTPEQFNRFHRPLRERLLLRPTIAIIVCVSKEDPDVVLGWIAVEKPDPDSKIMLHYLYVKWALRREGLGRELLSRVLNTKDFIYTHKTRGFRRLLEGHPELFNDIEFHPHSV